MDRRREVVSTGSRAEDRRIPEQRSTRELRRRSRGDDAPTIRARATRANDARATRARAIHGAANPPRGPTLLHEPGQERLQPTYPQPWRTIVAL